KKIKKIDRKKKKKIEKNDKKKCKLYFILSVGAITPKMLDLVDLNNKKLRIEAMDQQLFVISAPVKSHNQVQSYAITYQIIFSAFNTIIVLFSNIGSNFSLNLHSVVMPTLDRVIHHIQANKTWLHRLKQITSFKNFFDNIVENVLSIAMRGGKVFGLQLLLLLC
ncbi:hypothetical protein RFI_25805, partial [Reticulomyxa filosa]